MKSQVNPERGRRRRRAVFGRGPERETGLRTGRTLFKCLLAGAAVILSLSGAGNPCAAFEGSRGTGVSEHIKGDRPWRRATNSRRRKGNGLLPLPAGPSRPALLGKEAPAAGEGQDVAPRFAQKRGTFVTLTMDGGLRGCIGHILPRETVLEGVKENALNAAFRDPRFPPLSPREWDRVKVEVSILTDPKPLAYDDSADLLEKLRPGVDGVILRKGIHQATFLPPSLGAASSKVRFPDTPLPQGRSGCRWPGRERSSRSPRIRHRPSRSERHLLS